MDSAVVSKYQKPVGVPEPTVRRMPKYLNLLKSMQRATYSFRLLYIARLPGTSHFLTKVVKDLAYTGITGKPRVGYSIEELILATWKILGFNRKHEAFLVGAGFLGSALIQYQGFKESGMRIVAIFDIDKQKVGKRNRWCAGISFGKIPRFAQRTAHFDGHPISTPTGSAQNIADLMAGWGIKAIWNFAPVTIKVPDHVFVQDTHLYANMAVI